MTWQRKHDIILEWIDSCKTFDQLMNMIDVVKRQSFDTASLLSFIKIKASQLQVNAYYNLIKEVSDVLKS